LIDMFAFAKVSIESRECCCLTTERTEMNSQKVARELVKIVKRISSGSDREAQRANALDNEHFADEIIHSISRFRWAEAVSRSDVDSYGEFNVVIEVEHDGYSPPVQDKRGAWLSVENKPVIQARSASSEVKKMVKRLRHEFAFDYNSVEVGKQVKLIKAWPYEKRTRKEGDTKTVIYDPQLDLNFQIF